MTALVKKHNAKLKNLIPFRTGSIELSLQLCQLVLVYKPPCTNNMVVGTVSRMENQGSTQLDLLEHTLQPVWWPTKKNYIQIRMIIANHLSLQKIDDSIK